MKTRNASLSLLTIAWLLMAVTPAMAQFTYNNGAPNWTTDAWTINSGFSVSDNFDATRCGAGSCLITDFSFGAWAFPGDTLDSVELQLGSSSFGTDFGDLTLFRPTLEDQGTNQFGFDKQVYTFILSGGPTMGATPWVTLSNASIANGDPIYWDENSGPSLAFESSVGSISSEAFTLSSVPCGVHGPDCPPPIPEPSSIMLFGSGILSLAGILRRKLNL
jgi:hypothetical protein